MNVIVQCVHCARSFEAPRDQVGRRIRCPLCQQEFTLNEFHVAEGL